MKKKKEMGVLVAQILGKDRHQKHEADDSEDQVDETEAFASDLIAAIKDEDAAAVVDALSAFRRSWMAAKTNRHGVEKSDDDCGCS